MEFPILEKAQAHLQQKLPFVLYKKPKELKITGIFQHNDYLHRVKDFTEYGFVFAPFDDEADAYLIAVDELIKEPFRSEKETFYRREYNRSENNSSRSSFEALVEKAVETIKDRELIKVVVSRKKEIQVSLSAITIFQRLVNTYDNAFCYLWYHPKVGTWLGATPEILVNAKGNAFTTMSLAGTQINDEKKDVLNWGEKELYEQQLVTEYIEQVLSGRVENLKIGSQESVKAGRLWHLRTKISGNFLKGELGKLIRLLHPTPAVCGLPKESAKAFILENENYDRSFYTGFLGELNFRNEIGRNKNHRNKENNAYKSVLSSTELFVNLRCMRLEGKLATLYVGGGITLGSEPQKEWEETENKSETLLKVLLP